MRTMTAAMLMLILAGIPAARTASAMENEAVPGVVVTDLRTEERKKRQRDSVMSSTVVLGDKTIKPSGLVRFQQALKEKLDPSSPIELVVEDFAVIDYFPGRMASLAHGGGLLTDSVVRQMIASRVDWNMVESLGLPADGEAIVCLFSGTINGKAATVATFSTYKTSMTTISIRGSKPFKAALEAAIDKAATEAIAAGRTS